MQISARRHDTTSIVVVSGDIDLANSSEVRQSVLHEIREIRARRVIVNLSQIDYMDSLGVASLVEGLKVSRDLGSRFILFGLSPSVRQVLQLDRCEGAGWRKVRVLSQVKGHFPYQIRQPMPPVRCRRLRKP